MQSCVEKWLGAYRKPGKDVIKLSLRKKDLSGCDMGMQ